MNLLEAGRAGVLMMYTQVAFAVGAEREQIVAQLQRRKAFWNVQQRSVAWLHQMFEFLVCKIRRDA
jgi:hypothetical protein